MSKIVQHSLAEVRALRNAERKSPGYKARMAKLAKLGDKDINYSDSPEISDAAFAKARRPGRGGLRIGAGRKPSGRKPITIRLSPKAAMCLRKAAKKKNAKLSDVVEEIILETCETR